jgi:hypothetical protein
MNKACETVQDLLPELAAGRLSDEAARAARSHVRGCGECGRVLETLTLLAGAAPAVPDGLEARIQAAVASEFGEADLRSPGVLPSGGVDRGADGGAGRGAIEGAAGGASAGGVQRRSPLFSLPTWGLAAAAVLAAVAGRGVLVDGGSPGNSGRLDNADDLLPAAVLSASETELVALGAITGPDLVTESGMVAGVPVLDGLSDEDLMTLLEEWEG